MTEDLSKAERAAVVIAFRNLFAAAPQMQLNQVAGAVDDVAKADPALFRMLRGGYLLNDILGALAEEQQRRFDDEQRRLSGKVPG